MVNLVDISQYVAGHKAIIEAEEKQKCTFYQNARLKAEQIACSLKKEFTGVEVYLFGSLATELYKCDSDIDIAVKGLKEEDFYKAYRIAEDIAEPIPIDFIQVEFCEEHLRKRIQEEGLKL